MASLRALAAALAIAAIALAVPAYAADGDDCPTTFSADYMPTIEEGNGAVIFTTKLCPFHDYTGSQRFAPAEETKEFKWYKTPVLCAGVHWVGSNSDTIPASLEGMVYDEATAGTVGVALDGVAMFGPTDSNGRDAVMYEGSTLSAGGGHANGAGGTYHYHSTPVNPAIALDGSCSEHSPLLAIMFDGFGLFGPRSVGGEYPSDLDECNGHVHSDATEGPVGESGGPVYHYHTVDHNGCGEGYPYVPPCLRGKMRGSNSNAITSDCGDMGEASDQTGAEAWLVANMDAITAAISTATGAGAGFASGTFSCATDDACPTEEADCNLKSLVTSTCTVAATSTDAPTPAPTSGTSAPTPAPTMETSTDAPTPAPTMETSTDAPTPAPTSDGCQCGTYTRPTARAGTCKPAITQGARAGECPGAATASALCECGLYDAEGACTEWYTADNVLAIDYDIQCVECVDIPGSPCPTLPPTVAPTPAPMPTSGAAAAAASLAALAAAAAAAVL